MRNSCTKLQSAVVATAVSVGWAFPSPIQAASITYDLRLDNGSHSAIVSSPGTYGMQLWVDVTGTDGNHLNDGLQDSYVVVASQPYLQVGGGALVGGGGITSGAGLAPFNGNGYQVGQANDINGDGVMDWGITSTNGSDTNYMLIRSGDTTLAGSSVGDAVDSNTWEFEVATFTVHVNAVGASGDSTTFRVQQPDATKAGLFYAIYAVYQADGTITSVTSDAVGSLYSAGQGVTFIVPIPEPASLGLLGLGALGLLGRRRNRRKHQG